MIKRCYVFLLSVLLPVLAFAGAYEDLEEALIRNDAGAVIALVNRGIDVNSVDRQGNSLLTQAVQRDIPELFDFLLQRRARVNTRNRNGESALSIAAYQGRAKYVQRLVEAGAEINFYPSPMPPITGTPILSTISSSAAPKSMEPPRTARPPCFLPRDSGISIPSKHFWRIGPTRRLSTTMTRLRWIGR